jgi:uncharacterized caspase-like protein
MGAFRTIVLLVLATWLGCGSAFAEKRVALIIGNSAYKNVPKLTNPVNDASLVAEMFKNAGFDAVTTKLNLNVSEMRKTLREFGASTRDADMAVIYYAGHGIELDGNNYLIPTDATLETDADVLDETLPLDRVLFAVEPARRLRLIILDACRDNPFAKTMKRTIAARAVGRGLAKVEPTSPNTLIAFAAKAGSTAFDGDDKGSPFAMALVKHLAVPGLDIRKAFGYVRDDVLKATNNGQEPYVYGSLGGDDVPLVPARPAPVGPQPSPQSEVRRDYELALQTGDREAFEAFLRAYPTGFYADLANVQLKKIAAEEARRAAEAKARLAQQEKERLAAEEAKKAEQAKAAAKAKAAEAALLAAEKTSQIEAEKAAAVEQARTAAERIAAEKLSAESRVIDEPAARQPVAKETSNEQKLAALSSPTDKVEQQAAHDFARALQAELRRVGCNTGAVDGNWDANSQRALDLFNKHAGMKLETKIASADALDAVKSKTGRICPLVCDVGYKAEGDRCIKITCSAGYELFADGTCEKSRARKPTAKREKPKLDRPNTTVVDNSGAAPGKITRGGVTTCGPRGCQFVPKNCYAVSGAGGHGLGGKIFCQ